MVRGAAVAAGSGELDDPHLPKSVRKRYMVRSRELVVTASFGDVGSLHLP